MDPLSFLLGVVAVILTGIAILVAIKIYRKQKKEAKENVALLRTDHQKILKNQERQERIQKRVVSALYEIYTDEYPDMPLTGDSQVVLEDTAWATAETIVTLPAITDEEITLSEDGELQLSEDIESDDAEDEDEDPPQDQE